MARSALTIRASSREYRALSRALLSRPGRTGRGGNKEYMPLARLLSHETAQEEATRVFAAFKKHRAAKGPARGRRVFPGEL